MRLSPEQAKTLCVYLSHKTRSLDAFSTKLVNALQSAHISSIHCAYMCSHRFMLNMDRNLNNSLHLCNVYQVKMTKISVVMIIVNAK